MNKVLLVVLGIIAVGGVFVLLQSNPEVSTDPANDGQSATVETGENELSPDPSMSFFITSENPGTGADFGGLAGADQHCQSLASEVGMGDKIWRAYLSAVDGGDGEAVNARERVGEGPWYNFNGTLIASSLAELHGENNLNKQTALSEKGEVINGRGDTPNVHDILTGSNADGTLAMAEGDTTCSDWTASGSEGSAIVGHHDRVGIDDSAPMKSWNSSHGSRGCSLDNLNSTGGGGLLYCFANDSSAEEATMDTEISGDNQGADTTETEDSNKTFAVSGSDFAFDTEEIRVQEGDTVTINFTSEQGFHDWVVDEFSAATDQVRETDGVTSVTFVADKTGTYEYYCSVGNHRAQGMVGQLIVE